MATERIEQFRECWAAWREAGTTEFIAALFDVSGRTVARWLAAGLADHEPVEGLRTCIMVDGLRGPRWAIAPLGVIGWHVERLAAGCREAHAPCPGSSLCGPRHRNPRGRLPPT